MLFEFGFLVFSLLYTNAAGFYIEFLINGSRKRLEGKDVPKKVAKRLLIVVAIVHAYASLYFLMRAVQFYFNQRSYVYSLFDGIMLFMLLVIPFFAKDAISTIKRLEAV